MNCQQCGQAIAEWKVREYLDDDRSNVVRHWYICDVCLLEVYRPWIGNRIPPLAENQLWSSIGGGRVFRKATSSTPATPT